MGKVNWLKLFLGLIDAAPTAIALVERIHGDSKDGASKLQLASESLLAASGVAAEVDPNDAETISAVNDAGQRIVAALTPVIPAAPAPAQVQVQVQK